MMLVSHTVNLDDRRPEATLTSTAPVDTSAIVIEAGIIGSTSRLSASTPTPALSGEREMNPQSPIRAAVLPITSDLANPAAVTWRDNSSEQPLMREPHLSMLYEKDDVMSKHFGVTQKQALRTQALLRLGVTEEDVKIAERLLGSRLDGDCAQSKAEWLLGYTRAEMSYHKALEVLGVSEAVVEEERSRRLGELGVASWASPAGPDSAVQEAEDTCGGFFSRRRGSASQDSILGTTLPGEVAFAATNARVVRLEEVCQTQLSRIQQLEQQLAEFRGGSSRSDQ